MRKSPASSIYQLSLAHRLHSRNFSSPTSSTTASSPFSDDIIHQNPTSGRSFLKWVSGIVAGSSLGFLYWNSSSDSDNSSFLKKSFFSLTDLSTSAAEVVSVDDKKHPIQKIPKFIFGDAYRRRVFFNYEKRIRLRSPPEKVFEYFASFKTSDGEILMTPGDLMRAVVPVFPPSESKLVRDGYLRGERNHGELRCSPSEFFMLFDVNNDGLISFKEYIFFVTLLSIPESSFSVAFKMFDIDNNGQVSDS